MGRGEKVDLKGILAHRFFGKPMEGAFPGAGGKSGNRVCGVLKGVDTLAADHGMP